MATDKKYVLGIDYGTDSCRALVVGRFTVIGHIRGRVFSLGRGWLTALLLVSLLLGRKLIDFFK